jgi:hypothetical protein
MRDMGEAAWAPDLKALADRYEVLGELRGADDLRSYLARRRGDGADVTILVARAPRGGGNNALTHYAADTQLLTNIGHAGMPRVLEGRWLGSDSVAVVSERVRGSTLSALTSGDEPMSFPRVAAILQQVNGVLEWARSHGVVHRGVSLDSITVEDGSGRALVSLIPTAIPLEGVPDACADSRVLGALAFELLTGEAYGGGDPLAEMKQLRPQLAQRVRDEVRGMLKCQSTQDADVPDVHTFIAMIATADEMRLGEEERARLEAELVQKHRLECERWEAERKRLEDRIAADDRCLKEQRAALDASEAEHQQRLTADLAALEAQRQQADERTRIAEEHAARAEARAREIEERAHALEERTHALDSREADLEQKYASVMPTIEKPAAEIPLATPPVAIDAAAVDEESEEAPRHRSWTLPASAAAFVVLIILGLVLAHKREPGARPNTVRIGRTTVVPTGPAAPGSMPVSGAFVADSSAGSVVPLPRMVDSASGLATADGTTAIDSAQRNPAAVGAGYHPAAAGESRSAVTAQQNRRAPTRVTTPAPTPAPVYGPPAPTGPPSDTMVLVPAPVTITPPVIRPADTGRPRTDSANRDTTPRRDTTTVAFPPRFPVVVDSIIR